MKCLEAKLKLFLIGSLVVVPVGNVWGDSGHNHGSGSQSMHQAQGESHAHASPHGGAVKTVGNSHVELLADIENGVFHLYVLGDDSSTAKSLTVNEFQGQVKARGAKEVQGFEGISFKASDTDGASHFVANWTGFEGISGYQLALKIPIDGETYRVVFEEDIAKSNGHHHSSHGSEHSH